jgi:hypothetical protein
LSISHPSPSLPEIALGEGREITLVENGENVEMAKRLEDILRPKE